MKIVKSDNYGMYNYEIEIAEVIDLEQAKEMIDILNKEDSKYYYEVK